MATSITPLAVFVTDTHLQEKNIDLVENILVDQLINFCEKGSVSTVYHLGDFFNSRTALPLKVLKAGQRIFQKIHDAGIELTLIPGNHDKIFLHATDSYLDLYKGPVHVIDHMVSLVLTTKISLILIPYFKEDIYREKLQLACQSMVNGKDYVLGTHIAISGVKNNDGSRVENDLKTNLFDNFRLVFSGHYHNKQSLNDKIHYMGSSYQANFGEDVHKGFTVLYDDLTFEQFRTDFPEYVKIDLDIEDKDDIEKLIELKKEKNDNIRVVLHGDKSKLQAFDKSRFNEHNIEVKFESDDVVTNIDISNQELISFNNGIIEQTFDKFCELNNIDSKQGKTYLKQCGILVN